MSKQSDLLPVLQEEVAATGQSITDLVVKDQESLAEASDRIKIVKDLKKRIETEKELFTAPAKEIISAAKAKYDPLTEELTRYEKVLKEKAQAFMVAEEAKRLESEAKIAARVQKGTMRHDTAIRKIEAMPEATTARTANSGLRTIKRKEAEVFDEAQIPRGYFVLDMVKVRKDALAGIEIPGVRIIEKVITQSV